MGNPGFLATGNERRVTIGAGRSARWLVPVLYAVCGAAFVSDMYDDNTLAYGIIYTPLIATAVFHRGRSGLWILTAAACLMVVLGGFLPAVNEDLLILIGNRVLSVLAILATAAFVQHTRNNQDRLAAETRRAEAAERIKTQVLTNLSQEIRTPLHTLLGMVTLTMADSKPEQRAMLGQVRNDGKQLLATIDNLIDLTQIEGLALRRQMVDIATIARHAAESARTTARERQITVVTSAERETTAVGDSWAMRRILDNLLANAVRLTPPGGTVSVAVSRGEGTVTASVSDTGRGLPPELTEEFQVDRPATGDSALPKTGGTGLALSSRLARAMNGRLIARNQPGSGATVSLSLPAGEGFEAK
jgi:signal transduction histidine kinase